MSCQKKLCETPYGVMVSRLVASRGVELEIFSFSEDAAESKLIQKEGFEGFEGKIDLESDTCACDHEGNEDLSLNDLKVDSNLEFFRRLNFDSNAGSNDEARGRYKEKIKVSELVRMLPLPEECLISNG